MLGLPLSQGQQPVGALVFGLAREQIKRLEKQTGLLDAFAADAAAELLKLRVRKQNLSTAVSSSSADNARTRKIVHEVSNPLSIVRNYLQVLGMKLGGDHPAQKDLQIMEEELVRMTGLMQQLTSGETTELAREPVAVNTLIDDVARLVGESLLNDRGIDTELELDRQLPPILSNAGALKQILINLIRNASEALEDSGKVRIRSRDWHRVDASPFVEIEVSDDGPGIPLEQQEGLFQPMTSNKGGGHAGIGLSIVKELVEELGGSIGFNSSEESGTSFRLLLPRVLADRRSPAGQDNRV
jgi:signal transduction histidine kinase